MRVLQVIPDLSISNGAMSMIMNYQRAMSADVQFDYLYFLSPVLSVPRLKFHHNLCLQPPVQ